jgi:transcriptional regulator with XRE-family HTH domain
MYSRKQAKALIAFGKAVRKRREELGLSQEKLAEFADLHRTYIADVERGSRNIGLLNVLGIAEALGLAAPDLLMGVALKGR